MRTEKRQKGAIGEALIETALSFPDLCFSVQFFFSSKMLFCTLIYISKTTHSVAQA